MSDGSTTLFWYWRYGAVCFEECDDLDDAVRTYRAMEDNCWPIGAEILRPEREWLPYFSDPRKLTGADNAFTAAIRRLRDEETAAWRAQNSVETVIVEVKPPPEADLASERAWDHVSKGEAPAEIARLKALVGADRVVRGRR